VCEWDDDREQEVLRGVLVGGLDRAEDDLRELIEESS